MVGLAALLLESSVDLIPGREHVERNVEQRDEYKNPSHHFHKVVVVAS